MSMVSCTESKIPKKVQLLSEFSSQPWSLGLSKENPMSGEEMLREIDRREYYHHKFREHCELVECTWLLFKLVIIGVCLVSIAAHVRELLQGL